MFTQSNNTDSASDPSESPFPMSPPEWSMRRLWDVPFRKWCKGAAVEEGISMPGGYWVSRALLVESFRQFWRSSKSLTPTRRHTARAMCNDPGWEDRPRGQRLAIGRCFKYFEVHQILPITLANPGKRGTHKYFLNPGLRPSPKP